MLAITIFYADRYVFVCKTTDACNSSLSLHDFSSNCFFRILVKKSSKFMCWVIVLRVNEYQSRFCILLLNKRRLKSKRLPLSLMLWKFPGTLDNDCLVFIQFLAHQFDQYCFWKDHKCNITRIVAIFESIVSYFGMFRDIENGSSVVLILYIEINWCGYLYLSEF